MPPCHQAIGVILDGVTSSVCIVVLFLPVTVIHYHFIHHVARDSSFFSFSYFQHASLFVIVFNLTNTNSNHLFFFFSDLINCDVFVFMPDLFYNFKSILRLFYILLLLMCLYQKFPSTRGSFSFMQVSVVVSRQCLSNQPLSFY